MSYRVDQIAEEWRSRGPHWEPAALELEAGDVVSSVPTKTRMVWLKEKIGDALEEDQLIITDGIDLEGLI